MLSSLSFKSAIIKQSFFYQRKLDELFPGFDLGDSGEDLEDMCYVPFILKLFLLVFVLLLLLFLIIAFSVGQIPKGWLQRNESMSFKVAHIL